METVIKSKNSRANVKRSLLIKILSMMVAIISVIMLAFGNMTFVSAGDISDNTYNAIYVGNVFRNTTKKLDAELKAQRNSVLAKAAKDIFGKSFELNAKIEAVNPSDVSEKVSASFKWATDMESKIMYLALSDSEQEMNGQVYLTNKYVYSQEGNEKTFSKESLKDAGAALLGFSGITSLMSSVMNGANSNVLNASSVKKLPEYQNLMEALTLAVSDAKITHAVGTIDMNGQKQNTKVLTVAFSDKSVRACAKAAQKLGKHPEFTDEILASLPNYSSMLLPLMFSSEDSLPDSLECKVNLYIINDLIVKTELDFIDSDMPDVTLAFSGKQHMIDQIQFYVYQEGEEVLNFSSKGEHANSKRFTDQSELIIEGESILKMRIEMDYTRSNQNVYVYAELPDEEAYMLLQGDLKISAKGIEFVSNKSKIGSTSYGVALGFSVNAELTTLKESLSLPKNIQKKS